MRPAVKTLCLLVSISCLGFAAVHAGWIENGVPLTRQWGASGPGVIVSGCESESIIVYPVCREGINHLVAQRLNSAGVLLWGADGVDLCVVRQDIREARITSDGLCGAIVTWLDSGGIYAQRVDVLGSIRWARDGAPLCTADGDRGSLQIASDSAGGAIVTWDDSRTGDGDIYAQRVNASGAILWTADGVPICTADNNQMSPQIVPVGMGGAIVTWADYRSGNWDIYAQRVSALGAVRWTANCVAVCTAQGRQYETQIVSDGADGAIVTWADHRGGNYDDIYAQRVTDSGAVRWTTDGIPLCAADRGQENPQIVSREDGGAIVTWEDHRNGDYDIYAQRVDTSGAILWTADGAPVCTAGGNQESSQIAADGFGGVIVTWREEFWLTEEYTEDNIYAQRVNAAGTIQWTPDGLPLCAASEEQNHPRIVSAGSGVAIVTWYRTESEDAGIYAQRVSAGYVQWGSDGVRVCAAEGVRLGAGIVSDSVGGAIVTWADNRSGNDAIYAQRVSALGGFEWTSDGVLVSRPTHRLGDYEIIADGFAGAIVTWADYGNGFGDIYAQWVNASGSVQWTAGGVAVCTEKENQSFPQIASDGGGGAIVIWTDRRIWSNYDIYAQRMSASGEALWTFNGVPICASAGNQGMARLVSDGAGGAIVTWVDSRGGNLESDIYAQRVNASGEIQWALDGVPLCTAVELQNYPWIACDGAGGAIVAWEDFRSGLSDIYAQRVNASGEIQWTLDGAPICVAANYQSGPQIVSDGAGGAIVAWQDSRNGTQNDNIYAQRVNGSGSVQWTADGVPLCAATGNQRNHQITSDGAGGAVVTWGDERIGDTDIYAQRVDASGAVLWTPNGVSLCTYRGEQRFPEIATDGTGGAIVAWDDHRCGYLIYAQRIRGSGEIVGTLLQNYSAAPEGESIRLAWALSEIDEGARFSISRASAPDWKYVELDGGAIVKDRLSFTFTDTYCLPGTTYKYRVECVAEGTGRRILFETDAITIPPLPVTLYQNHPNPFNPRTVIRFYLPEALEISLDVYDVAGERVATLAEGKREKGYHEVTWDGRNSAGETCSSGVYFSRLKAGKGTISRKMVIMR
jgi:predicted lipoprotein with Yx(FWY)xxD motif